jgi:hypothetical protein
VNTTSAHRDSVPRNVMVVRPGEVHDGKSESHGGYAYKVIYVGSDLLDSQADSWFLISLS